MLRFDLGINAYPIPYSYMFNTRDFTAIARNVNFADILHSEGGRTQNETKIDFR